MALPDVGPVTLASVKAQLGVADDTDDLALAATAAAVNAVVRQLPVAGRADGAASWGLPELADVLLGANMLAARLWARRNSPEGVATFGAEGPAYVQRNDPDVAMLLQMGPWARPVVG